MNTEKKYPFTGETNQRNVPFGNDMLTAGEYLCGIVQSDLAEASDYYKFTLLFRKAFAEVVDQITAIENEPDYEGMRPIATSVRGILEHVYALCNASLFEYVHDIVNYRPDERTNKSASTKQVWNGDADLANGVFGENYGIDWEYLPGSQSIKLAGGRILNIGDTI